MPELLLPDLTFPIIKYGTRQTPWDLRPLLYSGGASVRTDLVADLIHRGNLGTPILARLELVQKMHEEINGNLAGGGSRYTANQLINIFRRFVGWVDANGHELDLPTVANTFMHWTDHLLQRQRTVGDISTRAIYENASKVARLLNKVLQRRVGLMGETRIRRPQSRKAVRSTQADKQNLEETFKFGYSLLDICDSLPVDAIRGPLPAKISFRTGEVLEEWSGLTPPEKLKATKPSEAVSDRSRAKTNKQRRRRHAIYQIDASLRTRASLVNIRIEAELQVFISQTGMNLAQAHSTKNSRFHYTSHLDGYQVRRYKDRRSGEVEFDIYGEYKAIFERYLAWRNTIFSDNSDELLFPLVYARGRTENSVPGFLRLKKIYKKLGIRFIGPRELRNTRVNWLLRRSQDPEMTAEMAQHTKETLLRTYQEPNLQVTMVEIARFHSRSDPAISPPGPGWCVSPTPDPVSNIAKSATPPDCTNAAGCMFCTHQRDIDSKDHVWSLASFRYLKSLELAKYRPPLSDRATLLSQPAATTVDRLTAKLKFFETSSDARQLWVREGLARVKEGDYHPAWDGFIKLQELQQ